MHRKTTTIFTIENNNSIKRAKAKKQTKTQNSNSNENNVIHEVKITKYFLTMTISFFLWVADAEMYSNFPSAYSWLININFKKYYNQVFYQFYLNSPKR